MTQLTLEEALQQGIAHHQAGRLGEAEQLYRAILQAMPNHPDANHNLGVIAIQTGNPASALPHFKAALLSFFNLGRRKDAETLARSMVAEFPGDPFGWKVMGAMLSQTGNCEEALRHLRRAVELLPGDAEAHNNLGVALQGLGKPAEAEACYRNAVKISQGFARARFNLANTLHELGRYSEAEASYRQALDINPDFSEALGNLGITLCHMGNVKGGVKSLQEALRIEPHNMRTHGQLIFSMDLHPGFDTAALQAERQKWAALHADPLYSPSDFPNAPDPERVLRIGYVSADFRNHSAADGLVSLLGNFDRSRFEVYAYSNSRKADHTTELFRNSVTAWRNIANQSDEEAANLIRRDAIDILVDLSGHTGGERYLVFARKPAPIQVSAMGYPTGTGMRAMDALFVDPVVVPPEEKHLYAEEIRYLPCVIGYSAKKDYPEVNALPALEAGCVTFGSFNRLAKLSDETLTLWDRLLDILPDGRLILKAGELDDEAARNRVRHHFEGKKDRITLLGKTSWLEHVKACNLVDISLDPSPHGGGVTTIESIRMGVPVLTLRYPTFVGRASASILTTLGLTGWIAESPEDYVRIAIEKSRDLAALSELRAELRSVFSSSILGDPDYYLRAAEKEYRALWRAWCAGQTGTR